MITPIERYEDNLWLKRDDLFVLENVNGGKLRQALYLIEKNKDIIQKKYKGVVVCSCSNGSPQSAILSVVCKYYNFKLRVVTYKTTKPNLCLTIAQKNGAELYGTRIGWNSVIEAKAKSLGGFYTKMGFADDDIVDANISQVQNIPKELDYLVIPFGSGYNFLSVINGLKIYKKKVDRVIGVVVGKKPSNRFESQMKAIYDYTLVPYSSNYSTPCLKYKRDFDELYEAKAYDWIKKNLDIKNKKILLWVVGKRNYSIIPEKITFLDI